MTLLTKTSGMIRTYCTRAQWCLGRHSGHCKVDTNTNYMKQNIARHMVFAYFWSGKNQFVMLKNSIAWNLRINKRVQG